MYTSCFEEWLIRSLSINCAALGRSSSMLSKSRDWSMVFVAWDVTRYRETWRSRTQKSKVFDSLTALAVMVVLFIGRSECYLFSSCASHDWHLELFCAWVVSVKYFTAKSEVGVVGWLQWWKSLLVFIFLYPSRNAGCIKYGNTVFTDFCRSKCQCGLIRKGCDYCGNKSY